MMKIILIIIIVIIITIIIIIQIHYIKGRTQTKGS